MYPMSTRAWTEFKARAKKTEIISNLTNKKLPTLMQNELFIFPLIHLVNITSWAGYLLFWDRAKAIRERKKAHYLRQVLCKQL